MKTSTGAVVIVLGCVAAVTIVTALHQDTSQLMIVITSIIGGLLYGKVESINQNTNGNHAKLIALVERMSEQLAASSPGTPPDGPTQGETGPLS